MNDSICILPRLEGVGGPASFRARLSAGLAQRGIRSHSDPNEPGCRAVLVIAGTRRLNDLMQARRRGVRIVQRLDGMNWLHRLEPIGQRLTANLRHTLRAEYGNLVLQLIRTRLATHVVYQSEFVRDWWEKSRGKTPVSHSVIYNGVDLSRYTPQGVENPPDERWRILMVEGSLMGGYEGGLRVAVCSISRIRKWRWCRCGMWRSRRHRRYRKTEGARNHCKESRSERCHASTGGRACWLPP